MVRLNAVWLMLGPNVTSAFETCVLVVKADVVVWGVYGCRCSRSDRGKATGGDGAGRVPEGQYCDPAAG